MSDRRLPPGDGEALNIGGEGEEQQGDEHAEEEPESEVGCAEIAPRWSEIASRWSVAPWPSWSEPSREGGAAM